jgi:hypothetical protein
MLTEELAQEIRKRLPRLVIREGPPGGVELVIAAAHERVGDVVIRDEGGEATLEIGRISHGHFGDYREGVSDEEVARTIAEDIVSFLELLSTDRVLLWASGDSGRWRVLDENERADVHSDAGTHFFLWSGPL